MWWIDWFFRLEPEPEPEPDPCPGVVAADGFDFPVGPPDAAGYYDAQPFGTHTHLGSDWNGRGGGNTDLGDPVSAIADGVVSEAGDLGGGWGSVVRIVHRSGETCLESLYAHLDTIGVAEGAVVRRGDRIGTIGDAHGQYRAHLHLELRDTPGLPLGGGYGEPVGQLDPTAFVNPLAPVPSSGASQGDCGRDGLPEPLLQDPRPGHLDPDDRLVRQCVSRHVVRTRQATALSFGLVCRQQYRPPVISRQLHPDAKRRIA